MIPALAAAGKNTKSAAALDRTVHKTIFFGLVHYRRGDNKKACGSRHMA